MLYIFSFFQVASDMDKISSSPLLWQIALSDELLYAKKNGRWELIQSSWFYIHEKVTVKHHKLLNKWDLGDSLAFNDKYFAVLTEKIESEQFDIDKDKLDKSQTAKENKEKMESQEKEQSPDLSSVVPKTFWESSKGLQIVD